MAAGGGYGGMFAVSPLLGPATGALPLHGVSGWRVGSDHSLGC